LRFSRVVIETETNVPHEQISPKEKKVGNFFGSAENQVKLNQNSWKCWNKWWRDGM